MPIDFGNPFIGQNDHFLFEAIGNLLEGAAIVGVGRVTVPVGNLFQLVQ